MVYIKPTNKLVGYYQIIPTGLNLLSSCSNIGITNNTPPLPCPRPPEREMGLEGGGVILTTPC